MAKSANDRHALLAILMPTLDQEHAEGFIEHRKAKRAPMTALAARTLVNRLLSDEMRAIFPDPNKAVEEIVERGWQTIKPEWMTNRPGNQPQRRGLDAAAEDLRQEIEREYQSGSSSPQGSSARPLPALPLFAGTRH